MRKKIKNKNILVIGDTILDESININATGISLESPTLKGNLIDSYKELGGTANTTKFLKILGCNVTFVTSISQIDEHLLEDCCTTTINIGNKTNKKSRYWIIKENERYKYLQINDCNTEKINFKNYNFFDNNYDVIFINDYRCGVVQESLLKNLKNVKNKIFVSAQMSDKKNNYFNYKNYDTAILNEEEFDNIIYDSDKNYIVTMGSSGCKSIKNKLTTYFKSYKTNVKNIIGAGDAFCAAYIATECCDFANLWAAYVISLKDKNNCSLENFYNDMSKYIR